MKFGPRIETLVNGQWTEVQGHTCQTIDQMIQYVLAHGRDTHRIREDRPGSPHMVYDYPHGETPVCYVDKSPWEGGYDPLLEYGMV